VHWAWNADGWLAHYHYKDFAGSGVVHVVGGVSGFVGANILGPRLGRFDPETDPKEFLPHNIGMVACGTLILWFGWFGFNGGSSLGITGSNL